MIGVKSSARGIFVYYRRKDDRGWIETLPEPAGDQLMNVSPVSAMTISFCWAIAMLKNGVSLMVSDILSSCKES